MNSTTLFELNEYVRRVMALNFPEPIWVSCEIVQVSQSKEHYYLELVEKSIESDEIRARSQGILWQRTQRRLQKIHGSKLKNLLQEGMEVLLQVQIDFHEQYGLKLIIEDIDPTFTLGKLAIKRQAIIDQLVKQQLLHKNKAISLPITLQNIAVISTENAAGYQDFTQQLADNEYGYSFHLHLYSAAMQGKMVEKEILLNLKKIKQRQQDIDAVVIIRGGGAKLDLAAFDSLNIGIAVADFPLPVLVGIGHEIDETILDLVAHKSLKTPTAVADFLLNHHLQFESLLVTLGQNIMQMVQINTKERTLELQNITQNIEYLLKNAVKDQKQMLEYIELDLPKTIQYRLRQSSQKLDYFESLVKFLSPEATLKRGFTITHKNGKLVTNTKNLNKGDKILTKFAEGEIESIVDLKAAEK